MSRRTQRPAGFYKNMMIGTGLIIASVFSPHDPSSLGLGIFTEKNRVLAFLPDDPSGCYDAEDDVLIINVRRWPPSEPFARWMLSPSEYPPPDGLIEEVDHECTLGEKVGMGTCVIISGAKNRRYLPSHQNPGAVPK